MTETQKPILPSWYEKEFKAEYKAEITHEFILYGDIHGLIPNPHYPGEDEQPYVYLKEFLGKAFHKSRLVVFF